jgi:hypothetical protein
MSAINGDKARFHRKRKNKIARRARNRVQLKDVGRPKPDVSRSKMRKKEASA